MILPKTKHITRCTPNRRHGRKRLGPGRERPQPQLPRKTASTSYLQREMASSYRGKEKTSRPNWGVTFATKYKETGWAPLNDVAGPELSIRVIPKRKHTAAAHCSREQRRNLGKIKRRNSVTSDKSKAVRGKPPRDRNRRLRREGAPDQSRGVSAHMFCPTHLIPPPS